MLVVLAQPNTVGLGNEPIMEFIIIVGKKGVVMCRREIWLRALPTSKTCSTCVRPGWWTKVTQGLFWFRPLDGSLRPVVSAQLMLLLFVVGVTSYSREGEGSQVNSME